MHYFLTRYSSQSLIGRDDRPAMADAGIRPAERDTRGLHALAVGSDPGAASGFRQMKASASLRK
jgi:hypothetical protein